MMHLVDSFCWLECFAGSKVGEATLYTQDAHFRDLPGVRYFEEDAF